MMQSAAQPISGSDQQNNRITRAYSTAEYFLFRYHLLTCLTTSRSWLETQICISNQLLIKHLQLAVHYTNHFRRIARSQLIENECQWKEIQRLKRELEEAQKANLHQLFLRLMSKPRCD
jgi:hypothetical protein